MVPNPELMTGARPEADQRLADAVNGADPALARDRQPDAIEREACHTQAPHEAPHETAAGNPTNTPDPAAVFSPAAEAYRRLHQRFDALHAYMGQGHALLHGAMGGKMPAEIGELVRWVQLVNVARTKARTGDARSGEVEDAIEGLSAFWTANSHKLSPLGGC